MCFKKKTTKRGTKKNNKKKKNVMRKQCMYNLSWDKVIEKYCAYMHHLLWSWFFLYFFLLLLCTWLTLKCALNQHYHCRWCNWTLILYLQQLIYIYIFSLCLLNVINVHTIWLVAYYTNCASTVYYIGLIFIIFNAICYRKLRVLCRDRKYKIEIFSLFFLIVENFFRSSFSPFSQCFV